MLLSDDWQQCGLTDLSDLQSQSHTVCTIEPSPKGVSAKVPSRENQDPIKAVLVIMIKASQTKI